MPDITETTPASPPVAEEKNPLDDLVMLTSTDQDPDPNRGWESSAQSDEDEDADEDSETDENGDHEEDDDGDDPDPNEGGASGGAAELPAGFDPTNPATWPESDIPHVRAAQAEITRYQQDLAAQKKEMGVGAELLAMIQKQGVPLDQLAEQLREFDRTGQAPSVAASAPPALPEVAYRIAGEINALRVEMEGLDESNYDTVYSSPHEFRQAQRQLFLLERDYQREVDGATAAQNWERQARETSLAQEFTRLEQDPRFKVPLSNPQMRQTLQRVAQNPQAFTPEMAVKAGLFDQMMVEAAHREKAAEARGYERGRTGKKRAVEASVPTGRASGTVVRADPVKYDKQGGMRAMLEAAEQNGEIRLRTAKR